MNKNIKLVKSGKTWIEGRAIEQLIIPMEEIIKVLLCFFKLENGPDSPESFL